MARPPKLTRRRFLALGAAGLVGACSPGGDSAGPSGAGQPPIVGLFGTDHVIAAGRQQRIPFAVVDIGQLPLADDDEVIVTVLSDGSEVDRVSVFGRVVEHDHSAAEADPNHAHADLHRYFALRTTLPEPGIYDLEIDFGNGDIGQLPVQAFDPATVGVALPGEPLPAIATPTIADPEGISPLCTRFEGQCGFHEHSVGDVLGSGEPLALLVATPALCQTAYCGPVLETLIDVAPDFDDVTSIHLELYENADDVNGDYNDPSLRLAQQVTDLGLTFEPSLFLVDPSGIVVDRIDNIFDRSELVDGLRQLTSP